MGFSPNGKAFALVVGGQYAAPRVWDTTTGTEQFANPGHPAAVQSLAVIEDGKTLVSGAADNQLRFWDRATGTAKKPFDLLGTYLELSADGGRLLTVSSNGSGSFGNIRIYETASFKQLAHYNEIGKAVALSPDGKAVAVRTESAIRVYDIDAEKLLADEDFKPSLLATQGFAFGPDSKKLIAQPFNGLLTFDALAKPKPKNTVYLQTEGFVRSPDGKHLAAILGKPERVAILDSTTGREVTSYKMKTPTAISWSRDGKWVGTADGLTLYVWSATTGQLRLKRIGHDGAIRAITFSADGKNVITGGDDNLVYVWDLPAK
jgi:WD40 repeat protein